MRSTLFLLAVFSFGLHRLVTDAKFNFGSFSSSYFCVHHRRHNDKNKSKGIEENKVLTNVKSDLLRLRYVTIKMDLFLDAETMSSY